MHVTDLTREKWREFKEKNNLSKSSFFSKADVGPTIDSLQKAVTAFKGSATKRNLESVVKKAGELQKAFAKFIQLKEFKEELKDDAKARINKWSAQINDLTAQMADIYRQCKEELKENDRKELFGIFDQCHW